MAPNRRRLLKPAKKLRKLVKKIDRRPSPDDVHDFRTNTRRLEATFEVLSLGRPGLGGSMLQRLGRCRRRAGKVRDMDVLTSHASTIHLPGEEACAVQLLERLGALRRRKAKNLHSEVRRVGKKLRKELKRAPALVKKAVQGNNGALDETGLIPNAAATAVKLAIQLATPSRLGRENLHLYRLTVKELRNVLQMAAGSSHLSFVDELGKVKDAIGEWHDWEELIPIARKALDHGTKCRMLSELKSTANRKYEHALSLAEALRQKCVLSIHSPKNATSSARPKVAVWQAIAMLAA